LPGWAIACAALLGATTLLGASAASGRSVAGRAATARATTHPTGTPGRRRIAVLLKAGLEAR
jgi:hypothetical protein